MAPGAYKEQALCKRALQKLQSKDSVPNDVASNYVNGGSL